VKQKIEDGPLRLVACYRRLWCHNR